MTVTPIKVALLGSTGSIGLQTLDIARKESHRIEIVALGANSSWETLCEQAMEFNPTCIALADDSSALRARERLSLIPTSARIDVGSGDQAIVDLIEQSRPDIVVNALVGSAGLRATLATLASGARLALANKESLVVGGELVMPRVQPGQMIPVDSEHSAIFQCLLGEDPRELKRIWLTASGGPFRGRSRAELLHKTQADALAHPTWNMGPKITVDSATLMNKGLEVIEARHLFDCSYDEIAVVVHPQSCIHSMVEYVDGSVKAHLGATDMRIPIQLALSFPERWSAPLEPVDFRTLSDLTFEEPDLETFGCLQLAFDAGRAGGSAPVILNAANEVAVELFLKDMCSFLDIEHIVRTVLDSSDITGLESVGHIEDIDMAARRAARAVTIRR